MKYTYTKLWLLLASALVVILVIAFASDIRIGGWSLKKAPMGEYLLKERQDAATMAAADSAAKADSLALEEKKLQIDTLPQNFLIFGDSMTLNLAYRLAQYAKASGGSIHTINWDSSSSVVWANSDTLDYYIKKFQPTFIFISLGSNELFLSKPEARRPTIEKLLSKIGDIPHVWIGPPNWKKDSGFNDLLASANPPGTFFRTEGMEMDRKKDKIHPTRKASAEWMDSIMRWMPQSAHPIRVTIPSDTIGEVPVNMIYIPQKK